MVATWLKPLRSMVRSPFARAVNLSGDPGSGEWIAADCIPGHCSGIAAATAQPKTTRVGWDTGTMGHIDVQRVSFALPDGRNLLDEVTFRVGDGQKAALIGPNGAGKTTLLRIIMGDLAADSGAVVESGGLGVMRQFVGSVRDESTVRELLLSVAPPRVR